MELLKESWVGEGGW